jgi:GMP synthase (glutamine-hydrolysing)
MLLVVDNISSYFNDLLASLKKIDAEHEVRRYDNLDSFDCDGIILSGRMNSTKSMNVANMRLVRSAYENDKPLLGICYGAEIIALTFNGSLRKMDERVIGERSVNIHKNNALTEMKRLEVFESHGYYISRLPKGFESVASSDECEHEIVMHYKKSIFGTQFHPEVSKDGLEILSNFVRLTKR